MYYNFKIIFLHEHHKRSCKQLKTVHASLKIDKIAEGDVYKETDDAIQVDQIDVDAEWKLAELEYKYQTEYKKRGMAKESAHRIAEHFRKSYTDEGTPIRTHSTVDIASEAMKYYFNYKNEEH